MKTSKLSREQRAFTLEHREPERPHSELYSKSWISRSVFIWKTPGAGFVMCD